jgi:hypothetical protein
MAFVSLAPNEAMAGFRCGQIVQIRGAENLFEGEGLLRVESGSKIKGKNNGAKPRAVPGHVVSDPPDSESFGYCCFLA